MSDGPADDQQLEARDELYVRADLNMPGRQWSLLISPTPNCLAAHVPWAARQALAGGLLYTALLGAYVLNRIGHATKIEGLATELSDANEDLKAEVTERKQAEEALTYQVRLLENVSDAVIASDERFVTTAWNQAAEKMYGWTADEILGRPTAEVLWPEFVGVEPDEVFRRLLEEGSFEGEVIHPRKDGTRIHTEARAIALRDEDGRLTGFVSIDRDITERKRAEEALKQQARDLERSNRELEQFAYVASHDLREPLRMISSYTQLLASRYTGRLDDDADEFIAYAADGAIRMQGLIDDLLAYSRLGANGRSLESTDCNAVLDQAVANLAAAINENQATVTHDELPTIQADASQLAQVFQNLIANAIKFRRADPPCVHVSSRLDGPEWVLSVRDNGIGIEPDYADRIFRIFQRLHTREEYPGSGMGLAICKKIIERHGGSIWVKSQTGKGATFYFTIRGADTGDDNS